VALPDCHVALPTWAQRQYGLFRSLILIQAAGRNAQRPIVLSYVSRIISVARPLVLMARYILVGKKIALSIMSFASALSAFVAF
jgi:hypothetical protein